MADILLITLNARYTHASLGLRYLKANLGELESRAEILEFTISQNKEEMLEAIYRHSPKMVTFGIYIWNFLETTSLIKDLRELMPELIISIGGPEVSYEYRDTEVFNAADYLITGWGDLSFYELCRSIFIDKTPHPEKVIIGKQPPLDQIKLPYHLYTDEDIAHRTVYVEASRGCPYKCEFCLSSLDKTAWRFPLELFLDAMDSLYQRGLRQFKFIDRTFNLKKDFTLAILDFFLDKIEENPDDPLFLHFELVPDVISDELKAKILEFPDGSMQFEVGIQTLNPVTQKLISRRTDLVKAKENISWLSNHTDVHLHVDLIVGLPDETIDEFGKGFNELWSWDPQEIQVGILKRLKGTPIIRHTTEYQFKYSQEPPYSVLENRNMPFLVVQELERFAKFWDLISNSGRFQTTLPLILKEDAFAEFRALSHALYAELKRTHSISLDRLFRSVFRYLVERKKDHKESIICAMADDFSRTGIKGWPKYLGERPEPKVEEISPELAALPKRQQQHRR